MPAMATRLARTRSSSSMVGRLLRKHTTATRTSPRQSITQHSTKIRPEACQHDADKMNRETLTVCMLVEYVLELSVQGAEAVFGVALLFGTPFGGCASRSLLHLG